MRKILKLKYKTWAVVPFCNVSRLAKSVWSSQHGPIGRCDETVQGESSLRSNFSKFSR